MLTSVLIITVSLALLVYWFRYTCILLIRNAEGALDEVFSGSSPLTHSRVQAGAAGDESLDPLLEALNRDYRVITYLLQHASAISLNPVERRLLSTDFKLMRLWYRLTRNASPAQARLALDEMSSVLRLLAYRASENAAARNLA